MIVVTRQNEVAGETGQSAAIPIFPSGSPHASCAPSDLMRFLVSCGAAERKFRGGSCLWRQLKAVAARIVNRHAVWSLLVAMLM